MSTAKYRKALPVVEVAAVFAAILAVARVSLWLGFRRWQVAHLGFGYLSDTIFYFVIPVAVLILFRRRVSEYGFRTVGLRRQLGIGFRAVAVQIPIALLFPIMAYFGTAHYQWPGSVALFVAYLLGTGAILFWLRREPADSSGSVDRSELFRFSAFFAVSILVCLLLQPVSRPVAQAVHKLVFVGFLEECLFRGYVQSRLNDAFGRPFTIYGVRFGLGLIVTAVLFGHVHLLASGAEYPWAVWTTASGLFFGFVREKTGSVVPSGLAHGLLLAPTVFFSGS